jgi:hypothetical protein
MLGYDCAALRADVSRRSHVRIPINPNKNVARMIIFGTNLEHQGSGVRGHGVICQTTPWPAVPPK